VTALATRRAPRAVTIFTVALLVAGPPLEYLRYNHYPLISPEVLLPTALWVLCAVGIGMLLNAAPRPVRIVAFSLLLLVFVDWQFSDHVELSFKLVPVAAVAFAWLLERHFDAIAAVVLTAFYAASLLGSSPVRASRLNFVTAPKNTALPPIVYLILDEHIGIEGWPSEFASSREMQTDIRGFYLREGFRLFGKAYSSFVETRSSIPAVLNWPVEDPHGDVTELVPESRYRLTANATFRKLSAEGYQIRVYQSTYLDYCDVQKFAIRSCETVPTNSVANLSLHKLPPWSKAMLVGLYFLEHNSRIYAHIRDFYVAFTQRHPGWPRWDVHIYKSTMPGAVELLGRLQRDLRAEDTRGTVYFAHLLAPHHPYEFDEACRSQADPRRWLEIIPHPDRGTNTAAGRALRYALYAAQVGCLYRHLASLLQTIDSLPTGRQMVVILHGDHGSRITLHYPLERLLPSMVPSDFTDAFSTLFAIRAPGIAAGYDRRFVSVDELVGRALESGFARIEVPATEPHVVRIEGQFAAPFHTLRLSDTSLALPSRAEGGVQVGRR